MSQENERILDAALALDDQLAANPRINPSEADIAPEDATEVPDTRDVEAQRPAASRGR